MWLLWGWYSYSRGPVSATDCSKCRVLMRLFSPSEERSRVCEYVRDPADLIRRIEARYGQAAPGADVVR